MNAWPLDLSNEAIALWREIPYLYETDQRFVRLGRTYAATYVPKVVNIHGRLLVFSDGTLVRENQPHLFESQSSRS